MRDTIDMAREAGGCEYGNANPDIESTFILKDDQIKAFEALVRADEREQGQKWFDTVTAQHKADIDRAFSAGLAEGEKLAIEAAAPVQEPVAWTIWLHGPVDLFLHKQFAELEFERRNKQYPDKDRKLRPLVFGDTTPPAAQRQWVGLTPREIYNLWEDSGVPFVDWDSFASITRAIEAKLRNKNGWRQQHVTDGNPCWCEPETRYTDPETGASVIVHKDPQ